MTEKEWKGTGRQNEDACRTKDSGKKQHWKACVRCVVGTVTGYMDLCTGDEIKPIFDMDFGCDQRAYAGCRDPALWPQDKFNSERCSSSAESSRSDTKLIDFLKHLFFHICHIFYR